MSTKIRNAKFFPVIKGKKSDEVTKNAKKGTMNMLTRVILLKRVSMFDRFITVHYIT